jgi:hypothetical protein
MLPKEMQGKIGAMTGAMGGIGNAIAAITGAVVTGVSGMTALKDVAGSDHYKQGILGVGREKAWERRDARKKQIKGFNDTAGVDPRYMHVERHSDWNDLSGKESQQDLGRMYGAGAITEGEKNESGDNKEKQAVEEKKDKFSEQSHRGQRASQFRTEYDALYNNKTMSDEDKIAAIKELKNKYRSNEDGFSYKQDYSLDEKGNQEKKAKELAEYKEKYRNGENGSENKDFAIDDKQREENKKNGGFIKIFSQKTYDRIQENLDTQDMLRKANSYIGEKGDSRSYGQKKEDLDAYAESLKEPDQGKLTEDLSRYSKNQLDRNQRSGSSADSYSNTPKSEITTEKPKKDAWSDSYRNIDLGGKGADYKAGVAPVRLGLLPDESEQPKVHKEVSVAGRGNEASPSQLREKKSNENIQEYIQAGDAEIKQKEETYQKSLSEEKKEQPKGEQGFIATMINAFSTQNEILSQMLSRMGGTNPAPQQASIEELVGDMDRIGFTSLSMTNV